MKSTLSLLWILFCCGLVCKAQAPDSVGAMAEDTVGELRDSAAGREGGVVGSTAVFVHFNGIVKEFNKALLQWDVDSAEDGDYFVVERSIDANHYETIGALRKMAGNDHYELLDSGPPNGTNFYRIKYTGQGGQHFYSRAVQLSLSGDVDFKFYPNPVDKLFIIRTQHAVDIQVIDGSGGVRISRRLQPGIQVVNASSLEHGIYVLQVADKESNRIISSQLVKN